MKQLSVRTSRWKLKLILWGGKQNKKKIKHLSQWHSLLKFLASTVNNKRDLTKINWKEELKHTNIQFQLNSLQVWFAIWVKSSFPFWHKPPAYAAWVTWILNGGSVHRNPPSQMEPCTLEGCYWSKTAYICLSGGVFCGLMEVLNIWHFASILVLIWLHLQNRPNSWFSVGYIMVNLEVVKNHLIFSFLCITISLV